jgi:hypothetical protein
MNQNANADLHVHGHVIANLNAVRDIGELEMAQDAINANIAMQWKALTDPSSFSPIVYM